MNTCLLCHADLKISKGAGPRSYHCNTDKLPEKFNHYYVQFDKEGEMLYQGYVIGKYFVQAFIEGLSYIFLEDDPEMKNIATIPRALWINSTNYEQTLATVKLFVLMS
jgi:hypothetical protein